MKKSLKYSFTFIILAIASIWFLVTNPVLVFSQNDHEFSVDPAVLRNHVDELCSTPRYRNYRNIESLNMAGEYMESEFLKHTQRVERQEFDVDGKTYWNCIASFGPEDGERIIVGAHYDVCYEQDGADDNASGCAGLLELARYLGDASAEASTALSLTLTYRIDLVAYTLEEPPFFRTFEMGSAVHARYLHQNNIRVRAMISLEMIGYYSDEKGSQDYPVGVLKAAYPSTGDYIAVVGKIGQAKLTRQVKKGMKRNTSVNVESINAPASMPGIDFSDHLNYWMYKFDAVMITNTAFYRNRNYHQITDTPETLDYETMAKVVEGICGMVLSLD